MDSDNRHTRRLRLKTLCAQREEIGTKRGKILEGLQHLDATIFEMDRQIAKLAPVYALPDEVLLEIFEAAYTHTFPSCRNDEVAARHSPVAFSHVSRRFRRVALASPKVWACIHVALGQPDDYEQVVQAHLTHSRNQPLSFVIRYLLPPPYAASRDEDWDYYKMQCVRAKHSWNRVLTHFARWKNLAMFYGSMDPVVPFIYSLETGVFPLLESLYIWVDKRCTAEPIYEDGLRLDFHAPLLTKLSLCAEIFDVEYPPMVQNVTKLALCRMWRLTILDVTAIISHCAHSLRYLEISGDCIFEGEEGLKKVHLPVLQHLLVHSAIHEAWFPLLVLLDTPHLETLAVEDEESLNGFVTAIENGVQTFPTVRYLSISHTEEASAQKMRRTSSRFVRAFPSLVHLRIKTQTNKYRVMRQILGASRRPSGAENLPLAKPWPNLRCLTLESPDIDEFALKQFVYQQRRNTETFSHVHLRSVGEKPISASTEEYLVDRGMTVDWTQKVLCSRFEAYNWHSDEFIPWDVPTVDL